MNKKTTSLLRLAVCMAIAMTLILSAAATSLAGGGQWNSTNALVGTEASPANAAITKSFALGQETPTPNITFTFQITRVSINENTALVGDMPIIGNPSGGNNGTVTISYTQSDVYNAGNPMHSRVNQTDYLRKETQPLFPNTIQWTRTGVYLYRITELQTTNYYISDTTRETLTLSKAQYDLQVYVAAKTSGSGYYVWAIGAYPILNDAGTSTGSTVGNPTGKVNPQPGGPTGGGGTGVGPYSQMIFTNTYLRHGSSQPPTNPDYDHKFRIRKAIDGIGADNALYFRFEVTIRKPVISTKTSYRVYVYDTTSTNPNNPLPYNSIMQNVQNQTLLNTSGYIAMPFDTPVQVMLKASQYLAFTDIDAGATYIVNELGTVDYTPSYSIYKGNNVTPVQSQTGTQSNALSTPTTPPIIVTISQTNSFIDRVDFTNKYKDVIPTGIAVNDLPYITLVAIAAIALGGYLFFRIRSRKNDEVAVETN